MLADSLANDPAFTRVSAKICAISISIRAIAYSRSAYNKGVFKGAQLIPLDGQRTITTQYTFLGLELTAPIVAV